MINISGLCATITYNNLMDKYKTTIKNYTTDLRQSQYLFDNDDSFETYRQIRESAQNESDKTVVIPSTDKNDPDIVLDKDSFSQFIIGANELEVIEANELDAAVAGECLVDLFVYLDPSFDEEDKTLNSIDLLYYTNEHHRVVRHSETYKTIPAPIGRIPGFDIDQFLYEGWYLDDWVIRVKLTFNLQGGWYNDDESRYDTYPDLVNVKIKEMYIQTGRDVSQYFVQDLLNEEAYNIIKKICEEYIDDNIEYVVE